MSRMDIPLKIFALFAAGTVVAQAASDVHRFDAGRPDRLMPVFNSSVEAAADAPAVAEAPLALRAYEPAPSVSPRFDDGTSRSFVNMAARLALAPQPPPSA